jgi:hypothetical protein
MHKPAAGFIAAALLTLSACDDGRQERIPGVTPGMEAAPADPTWPDTLHPPVPPPPDVPSPDPATTEPPPAPGAPAAPPVQPAPPAGQPPSR